MLPLQAGARRYLPLLEGLWFCKQIWNTLGITCSHGFWGANLYKWIVDVAFKRSVCSFPSEDLVDLASTKYIFYLMVITIMVTLLKILLFDLGEKRFISQW